MATKTKPEANKTESNGSKPVQVYKAKGIRVSIFANTSEKDGKPTTFYKMAAPQKFYRDGEEWKATQSFSGSDLPVLQLLIGRAFVWIIDTEATQSKEEG